MRTKMHIQVLSNVNATAFPPATSEASVNEIESSKTCRAHSIHVISTEHIFISTQFILFQPNFIFYTIQLLFFI